MKMMQLRFPIKFDSFCGSEAATQKCSGKIGGLKSFFKFTRKRLCWSLFLNKVTDLRPANFFKKNLRHKYFPVNFVKLFRS